MVAVAGLEPAPADYLSLRGISPLLYQLSYTAIMINGPARNRI